MGEFHRGPSKVWWASTDEIPSWNQRSSSSSPGSQDSGFSDAETSPKNGARAKKTPKKDQSPRGANPLKDDDDQKNLSVNVKDKPSPKKVAPPRNAEIPPDVYYLRTPVRRIEIQVRSEPVAGQKFIKNCPKVSRNLFRSIQMESTCDSMERDHQYAGGVDDAVEVQGASIDSEVTFGENISWSSSDTSEPPEGGGKRTPRKIARLNRTAHPNEASFSSLSPIESDSDSELECLFASSSLESPKHTSTPKADKDHLGRRRAMNLLLKYQHERVPPLTIQDSDDGTAVKKWMQEARQIYEAECMTALQCKSIAAELCEKVSHLAAIATGSLRDLLSHAHLIQAEFDNLKNQNKHLQPLAQSLAGLVKEFVRKFDGADEEIERQCEELRNANLEDINELVVRLHVEWRTRQQRLLDGEIKKLVDSLGDPTSEFDLRAKLTGLTSITLRNEELTSLFTQFGVVQILVVLCEKCEGSSVRALALRALSTICSNTSAIRQFEKACGVQLITDVLVDDGRPEPERSEAVALLAQITAPWIEDNHNVRGLQEHTSSLVKSLTRLLKSTRCCQNLLLCTAALANLSAMDGKSVKYILHQNTVGILLDAVKCRGPLASVYLHEQVATLIANMSSAEYARKQLTDDKAPAALLCFLQTSSLDESVVRRLQQKSIIALSRLCSEVGASQQVVEMEGVEKLVKLCREKKERYDSDAVLVATLATLRKIAEACGPSVISPQDAQELVEPRLLDSFLAYSTQNESLV